MIIGFHRNPGTLCDRRWWQGPGASSRTVGRRVRPLLTGSSRLSVMKPPWRKPWRGTSGEMQVYDSEEQLTLPFFSGGDITFYPKFFCTLYKNNIIPVFVYILVYKPWYIFCLLSRNIFISFWLLRVIFNTFTPTQHHWGLPLLYFPWKSLLWRLDGCRLSNKFSLPCKGECHVGRAGIKKIQWYTYQLCYLLLLITFKVKRFPKHESSWHMPHDLGVASAKCWRRDW